MYRQSIKLFGLHLLVVPRATMLSSKVVENSQGLLRYSLLSYLESSLSCQLRIPFLRQYATSNQPQHSPTEGSAREVLLIKLENAVNEYKDAEACRVFDDYRRLYGYPSASLVNKLVTGLSYSSDRSTLIKACNLVLKIAKEKYEVIGHDSLSRLCLALSRAQMYVHASKVLRLMLQKYNSPTMDLLCVIFMHMVKTEAGTNVASNILLEMCDSFVSLSSKRSDSAVLVKPSTAIFNLILDASVRFGSPIKGQHIIEVMARTGVAADAQSVALFSHVYEMNGQRDELKMFKECVDQASSSLAQHYAQVYDNLLSLHFKFGDLDAASSLVEYLCCGRQSCSKNNIKDLKKPCRVPIGSPYLNEVLKVHVMFESLEKDSVLRLKSKEEFVRFESGKFVLTCKGLAQLIVKYQRIGRIDAFSKVLAAIQKQSVGYSEGSLCCDVIHACIYTGLLETAHDIIDDMEMANVTVPGASYMLLLNAYTRQKMAKEAEALANQIQRKGFLLDASDQVIVSECLSGVVQGTQSMPLPASIRLSKLTDRLLLEMSSEEKTLVDVLVLNSCLSFFCKAKMIEDARKTYIRFQLLNIHPTAQTFAYLIHGYSSLQMYREITILWGDMKRYMEHGCSLANRDLYELLVLNFLRGGYFERVMEIIALMKEHNMYADRWNYKSEFTKLHRTLYRRLKAIDAKNEAQKMRLEHVTAFRKWVRNS